MAAQLCPMCSRPCLNSVVCPVCVKDLSRTLHRLPGVLLELEATALRQSRINTGEKVRAVPSGESPLPFNPSAAEHLRECRAKLVGWITVAAGHVGAANFADVMIKSATFISNSTAMDAITAKRLELMLPRLGTAPFLPAMHAEITRLSVRAVQLVDLPLDKSRFYVGPCPEPDGDGGHCVGDIWAWLPRDVGLRPLLQCNECEAQWFPETWLRLGSRIAVEKQRREASARLSAEITRKRKG